MATGVGSLGFAGKARQVVRMRIDSHVHVWAPKDQASKYPFAGSLAGSSAKNEPPMPGHASILLDEMAKAKVDKAVIIQPGNHLYDHSYVNSVLKEFPEKFYGMLLADPTQGGGGVAQLEELVSNFGYRGVRFNPYLWPEGEKMNNKVGLEMYARAGELGVPVGHMPFKGLLLHIEEIKALLEASPATKCIIDHFGFCKCSDSSSQEWQELLKLASYEQVYVKTSAFFRVSGEDYPYEDARKQVRVLVDTFGAQRILFGTDWPWISEKEGYQKAWQILEQGQSVLTEEEKEWVYGKTATTLFS